MMRKVCPKCQIGTEISEISYPESRHTRMRITPNIIKGKIQLDTYDADVKEEWCEYSDVSQPPDYYCVNCAHHFQDAMSWDDVWEQMVWRKR
jgi:hypothetical protein